MLLLIAVSCSLLPKKPKRNKSVSMPEDASDLYSWTSIGGTRSVSVWVPRRLYPAGAPDKLAAGPAEPWVREKTWEMRHGLEELTASPAEPTGKHRSTKVKLDVVKLAPSIEELASGTQSDRTHGTRTEIATGAQSDRTHGAKGRFIPKDALSRSTKPASARVSSSSLAAVVGGGAAAARPIPEEQLPLLSSEIDSSLAAVDLLGESRLISHPPREPNAAAAGAMAGGAAMPHKSIAEEAMKKANKQLNTLHGFSAELEPHELDNLLPVQPATQPATPRAPVAQPPVAPAAAAAASAAAGRPHELDALLPVQPATQPVQPAAQPATPRAAAAPPPLAPAAAAAAAGQPRPHEERERMHGSPICTGFSSGSRPGSSPAGSPASPAFCVHHGEHRELDLV